MQPRTTRTLSGLATTTVLVMLAGCATSPAATGPGSNADRHRCVSTLSLSDWEFLDDSTLLVWTVSRRRAYRIELVRPMHDLRFEHLLRLADRNLDGRICPYGGDAILPGHPGVGPVSLASIEYLTAEQTAHLMAQRPHKRKEVKTVPPEPGDAGKADAPTAPPK
jgi:hypothetical protein